MSENKTKPELNENDLSSVYAGKDINTIVSELFPLASQYPEVVEIINAYQKDDYAVALMLIQKIVSSHPELASILND